jgi:bifunctional non-homologous end joining protein LigD
VVRLHSRRGYDWTRRMSCLAEALAGLMCTSAVIDGELVFPAADGSPDFYRLQSAMVPGRQLSWQYLHSISCTTMARISGLPLIDRRLQLTELLARSNVRCLHLVWGFDNGAKLLEAAERHGLEGIVSKRARSAYRSGPSRDWVKVKAGAWRAANRERWRFFEKR